MVEIFEEKFLPESWQDTFNLKDHVKLTNPSGLAITNDNNAFDIFKQNYVIEPGFSYTFRIIANQVIFSCEFH